MVQPELAALLHICMPAIHENASVHPSAILASNVTVGPFAVIEANARIGSHVRVDPHAVIGSGAVIGPECEIGAFTIVKPGAVIGDNNILDVRCTVGGHVVVGNRNRFDAECLIGNSPEHKSVNPDRGHVVIGNGNHFHPRSTIDRSTADDRWTRIGDNNTFLSESHVGHDGQVLSGVVLGKGAWLGGHVHVRDGANISAGARVFQTARIGELSFVTEGARIRQDVPPYALVHSPPYRVSPENLSDLDLNNLNPKDCVAAAYIRGMNETGISRAGIAEVELRELKKYFQILFPSCGDGETPVTRAQRIRLEGLGSTALTLVRFVAEPSRAGVTARRVKTARGE